MRDTTELYTADDVLSHARFRAYLGPIAALLEDERVLNVDVTGEGRIFVERLRAEREELSVRMSAAQRTALIELIANNTGRPVNSDRSSLPADMPAPYRGRVQAWVPPVAQPSLTIRIPSRNIIPIEDYVERGTLSVWWAYGIEAAIIAELSGIVSGNVNTGKTTFLNAILEVTSRHFPDYRPIGVQDREELRLECFPNHQIIMFNVEQARFDGDRYFRFVYGPQEALADTLRANGDRVIWQEVRDNASALGLLMVQNTGQRGLMTTAHTNGVEHTPRRISEMVTMATGGTRPGDETVAEVADFLVHMAREPDLGDGAYRERRVTELAALRTVPGGYRVDHFPAEPPSYVVDVVDDGAGAYAVHVPALPEVSRNPRSRAIATAEDAHDVGLDLAYRAAAARWWRGDMPASDC